MAGERRLLALLLALLLATLPAAGAPGTMDDLAGLDPQVAQLLREARAETEANVAALNDAGERRDAWGRLAMLYHSQHLPYAAEAFYTRALDAGPSARWHYLRGIVLSEQGELERALADYSATVELDDDNFAAWYRLGAGHLLAGDLEAAEAALGEARRLSPRAAIVLTALADCAVARGDLSSAEKLFLEAHELAPEATQIAYKLAMLYRRRGDVAGAREWLARRGATNTLPEIDDPVLLEVAQLSQSGRFFVKAGEWALERGDYEQAIEVLTRAVALAPNDPVAGYAHADALTRAGRVDEAVAEVERVLALHPDSAQGWYTLAWLLRGGQEAADGRAGEALAAARRSLVLAEDDRARALAGALAMRTGAFADAAQDYAMLAERVPEQAYYHFWLGMALAAAGDCGARGPIARALRLERAWGEAHVSLARLQALCGEAADARNRAAALLRARDDVDTRLTLAFAVLAEGKPVEARALAAAELPHADARLLIDAIDAGRAPGQPFAPGSPWWIPAEAR